MKKQRYSLLCKPISFNRYYVDIAGTTDAALLLSQAVYWNDRTNDPQGWFYKTQEEWRDETGLTRSQQECARKRLRAKPFWQERLRGNPAKLYFRVDCRILQTCLVEVAKLECENLQTSTQESASSLKTEITSETTNKDDLFQIIDDYHKGKTHTDEQGRKYRISPSTRQRVYL